MPETKNLPRLFWSGFVLIFLIFLAILFYRLFRSPVNTLPVYGTVPNFTLTNQFNQIVTPNYFSGKVWIANFIFTTCPGPCLRMSERVKLIQDKLTPEDNIYLVSFTVDPETDTPEVLQRYSQQLQADPERWFFLTGNQATIFHLATKGFLLAVEEAKEAEAQRQYGRYIHSTKFALVDAEGRVRAYYEGTETESLPKLIKEARSLTSKKIP